MTAPVNVMPSFPSTFVPMLAGALALGLCASCAPSTATQVAPGSASLEAVVVEIDAGTRATPVIGAPAPDGSAEVMFLAKRSGDRVPRIVSDVTGWGENVDGTFDFTTGAMLRVGASEWYSLKATVAARARIEYLIAYAPNDYQIDPHNPRQSVGPQRQGARASEFVLPGYVPSPALEGPPTSPAGGVTEIDAGRGLPGGAAQVAVYTPPGYRPDHTYPLAVFLDGRAGLVSRVVDWLIARQAIEPIVVAFVGPSAAGDARPVNADLHAVLAREWPAWLASHYSVSRDPSRRAILGVSFGAKDALDTALSSAGRPDGFGLAGLLIPGRRIGRAGLEAIGGHRGVRLRVAILAGHYDQANLATALGVRDALSAGGHLVHYAEVPEGHNAVTWSNHLGEVLVSLFGAATL